MKIIPQKLKDFLTFDPYIWRDLYYNIKCWFRPQNRWVMKNIPNRWVDKDTIIETILFDCVVHYIEEEKTFEKIEWSNTPEIENMLKEIHQWVKTDRKLKFKERDAAYPPFGEVMKRVGGMGNPDKSPKKSYEELYGEVERLEKFIESKDTEYLRWIVEHREYLWV